MFREFEVADIVIVESDIRDDFAKQVGEILTKENVVDIQYSTVLGVGRVGPIMIYSALILVGTDGSKKKDEGVE